MKPVLSFAPMTLHEIIKRFGGPTAVGNHLGIRSQAVSLWMRRGQIPMARVPALVTWSRKRRLGLTAQQLRPDIKWGSMK